MILRDQLGEIEAGLGDLFSYKGCTLEIVCPAAEASVLFEVPILWVRLVKGRLEHDDAILQVESEKSAPVILLDADLVATCLRSTRPDEAARPVQHPPEFEALESYQEPTKETETKASRAKNSKARPEEDQPTLW